MSKQATPADPYVWRYRKRGNCSHAMPTNTSSHGHGGTSVCGTSPLWYESDDRWLGDGSDEERAIVARMRRCGRCVKFLAARGIVDPDAGNAAKGATGEAASSVGSDGPESQRSGGNDTTAPSALSDG